MTIPAEVARVAAADGARLDAYTRAGIDETDRLVDAGAATDPARWRDSIADAGPQLLALQQASVVDADQYLAEVLAAQGASDTADADLAPAAFVDLTDGGGSWLRNLVFSPPAAYRAARQQQATEAAASARARFVAAAIVGDGIRDAARAARGVAMAARPSVKGYVRMLNGVSCARCAVLAGRRYRVSAFQRHPRCDCRNVPTAEDTDDWTTSPAQYFRSLTREQQDAVFTRAGAEVLRLARNVGTTMSQVVNARAGITTVSAYGRDVQATTYATSVRGLYGGYEVQPDGSLRRRTETERRVIGTDSNGRPRTLRFATAPRLMPDEIFQLSEAENWDRAELLRQLRRFGYLL